MKITRFLAALFCALTLAPFAVPITIQPAVAACAYIGPNCYEDRTNDAVVVGGTPQRIGDAVGSIASTVRNDSIYAKMRRGIALARFNNPHQNAVMATPPTITAQASPPATDTVSYLSGSPYKGVWRLFGGTAINGNGGPWNVVSTSLPPGTTPTAAQHYRWCAVFDSNKPSFQVYGSTLGVRFIVGGQYVSLTPTTTATASGAQQLVLDFTSAGGRAVRPICLEWASSATGFYGAWVAPTENVTQMAPAPTVHAFFGDSYFADSPTAIPSGDALAQQIADDMGTPDGRTLGIGGTGCLNPGSSGVFGAHVADLAYANPDAIHVGSAANDYAYVLNGTTVTSAQITACFTSLIQSIRALPGFAQKPIFAYGSWTNQFGQTAASIAADNAVLAAVTALQAAGDKNLFFLSPANDNNGPWINGTGCVGSTTGTGNSDVYGFCDGHLNAAGWKYFAGRAVDQISQLIASVP